MTEEYYIDSSADDNDDTYQVGESSDEEKRDETFIKERRRVPEPILKDIYVSMEPNEVFQYGHPNQKLAKVIEKVLEDRERLIADVGKAYTSMIRTKKDYSKEKKQVAQVTSKLKQMKDNVTLITQQVDELQENQQEAIRQTHSDSEKLKHELKATREQITGQQDQLQVVQDKIKNANSKLQQFEQLKEQVRAAQAKRERFASECKSQQELYEQQVRSYESKLNDLRSKQIEADMELQHTQQVKASQQQQARELQRLVYQLRTYRGQHMIQPFGASSALSPSRSVPMLPHYTPSSSHEPPPLQGSDYTNSLSFYKRS